MLEPDIPLPTDGSPPGGLDHYGVVETGEISLLSLDGSSMKTVRLIGRGKGIELPIDDLAQAIARSAPCLILMMHSHPSGDPRPSRTDIIGTRRLWRMARLLNARLVDHVIVAGRLQFSFRDAGLL